MRRALVLATTCLGLVVANCSRQPVEERGRLRYETSCFIEGNQHVFSVTNFEATRLLCSGSCTATTDKEGKLNTASIFNLNAKPSRVTNYPARRGEHPPVYQVVRFNLTCHA